MQTGHEKTLTALTAALAGTNLIYGLGMIESGVTFDYAQLVIDNEMARMVKHVVRGIRVDWVRTRECCSGPGRGRGR